MSKSPNTTHMPSFDDPVDPQQVGDQFDSRYLEWLKLNPEGSYEEWQIKHGSDDPENEIFGKH